MTTLRPYNLVPVDQLAPFEGNARTHDDDQVAQIAASIKQWGFTNPVLIDEERRVIAGHGRLLAAKELGLPEVPCLTIEGLSEPQRRALILADNKLALNAGWDPDLLKQELSFLDDQSFALELIGFSEDELIDILGGGGGGDRDPDVAPDPPETPRSVPGDVWVCGPHRVVCGDATSTGTYDALLRDERVDLVWTDPPYNVAYEGKAGSIKNDDMGDGEFLQLLRDALSLAFGACKPGAAIYVAHADMEGFNFRRAFKEAGFKLASCIIWHKDSLVLGRSDYQWIHEPILYGWRPGSRHRWYGGRKNVTVQQLGEHALFEQQSDGSYLVRDGDRMLVIKGEGVSIAEAVPSVVHEPKPKRSDAHPTMKPVALVERLMRHNSRAGDLVLDPFGGSGTTLVAADRMGLSARLIELDPRFVDVIVQRWQQLSGRRAVHGITGEAFG
jgi:DNA modification methylase